MMQYHPEIVNMTKIDDGYTALQVTAHVDKCDALYYLAAMVINKIISPELCDFC